jgi:hypothetical protein
MLPHLFSYHELVTFCSQFTMHSQRSSTSRNKRNPPTRRNKKVAKKSWLAMAKDNTSLRFTYHLFLCTLLPLVAVYVLLVTFYVEPSSCQEVSDGDDTSVSTNSTVSSDDDDDDVDDDERCSSSNRLSALLSTKPVRMIAVQESPKKVGYFQQLWSSLGSGDSSHMLKTIWCEDSLY